MIELAKRQLHRNPRLFGVARRLLFQLRSSLPPIKVRGLPGRVHPNDFMANRVFPGSAQEYAEYADHTKRHFDILSAGLQRAGRSWSDLGSVIDFGCGYGRVTRWLSTAMPAGRVTACDVQEEAVEWCAKEFGAHPLLAASNIVDTQFETYDLLFSISVVTHLSPNKVKDLFRLLDKIINVNGIVLFSAHGMISAKDAKGIKGYLDPKHIVADLKKTGAAFVPYPHYENDEIGDTFLTKQYVVENMNLLAPDFELISYDEASFWDCQDCYVFRKKHRSFEFAVGATSDRVPKPPLAR